MAWIHRLVNRLLISLLRIFINCREREREKLLGNYCIDRGVETITRCKYMFIEEIDNGEFGDLDEEKLMISERILQIFREGKKG